jgi:hypothetical protein
MADGRQNTDLPVLVGRGKRMMSIRLNRPRALNSLNTEMVRLTGQALHAAEGDDSAGFVVLRGTGDKGFCAGGDIKALAMAAKSRRLREAYEFFDAEYALDLRIHRFPKAVVVLADGITMGGGLGLSAGADAVVGTERTRMAMPESRIGLFPDVGATGWLFKKCPEGYPEFLPLTGTPHPSMLTGRVEGRFLQLVAQLSGAHQVVEIGTFTGYSALAMAEALPHDGELLTIEHNPRYAKIAQDFFDRSPGGYKITLRMGDALEVLDAQQFVRKRALKLLTGE